ncbi:thiamine phosphate synthase [Sphingomonas sp. RS2018]
MPRRHPIARIWLMTDPRMGDALLPAIRRLPRGAGVVFRHYDDPDRAALYAAVRRVARRRGLTLIVAGASLAGADGRHNARAGAGLRSHSAHNRREIGKAVRAGVDVIFASPVYVTRSHPDARPLGRNGLARLVAYLPLPVVALGGMDAHRYRALARIGLHGWAGIDAFTRQKRKAVPT